MTDDLHFLTIAEASSLIETKKLSFDIAEKIEKNVDFPGQIKVSVIRETRTSSIAG